jgi:LAO/AO transport system kinase
MPQIDLTAIRQGDRLALSRALTAAENGTPASREIQAALFPHTGNAHLIGITGAPGTGKSTLVNQLVKSIRKAEHFPAPKIAVIAVDPTSPFTGGALLGDRIRMHDLAGDKEVFIRSMASRGALGGLAHSTAAFATILDGAGFDLILIETVGAGQAEVDIARLAHTVIVVEAPGLGDDIQAIKAGILEIADILVVNKSDQPGAENTARALQAMLELSGSSSGSLSTAGKHRMQAQALTSSSPVNDDPAWQVPVLQVTATDGTGMVGLHEQIEAHREYLLESGMWQIKENQRLKQDLDSLISDLLIQHWRNHQDENAYQAALKNVIERKWTPLEAAESLL